jgi:hypothetical protein
MLTLIDQMPREAFSLGMELTLKQIERLFRRLKGYPSVNSVAPAPKRSMLNT